MPSRQIQIEQRQFEKRQQAYEKKYRKQFFKYLKSTYNNIAEYIIENGINSDWFKFTEDERIYVIYKKLYETVTLNEAKIEFNKTVKPFLPKQKDAIDDLIGIFVGFNDDSLNLVRIWRDLLNEFVVTRVTGRIQEISITTQRRITKIIEGGIENGDGAEVIARTIRNESGGKFNRNRSLVIARTETITSMNQGKYLSAQSSPFVMEKHWSPSNDARTRRSHRAFLDSGFIDFNENFEVSKSKGGVEPAQYPGDLRLSAENVIQCRCSLVTRHKRGDNGNLIRKATQVKNVAIYVTTVKTHDDKTYSGPDIMASSFEEAELFCKDHYPYCEVDGRLISRTELKSKLIDKHGKTKSRKSILG